MEEFEFVPSDIANLHDSDKATVMKFTVNKVGQDDPGEYHGTIHKEPYKDGNPGDQSCHVIANSSRRKRKKVRKGFWHGKQDYADDNGRYKDEVNFAYRNFCENDEYNPDPAFIWDDALMTAGRTKRKIHRKGTKKKRRSSRKL